MFALERAFDQRLRCAMTLVREGDVRHRFGRGVRVNHDATIAVQKSLPFEISRDVVRGRRDVAVHGALALSLTAHEGIELRECLLHSLQDVRFESGEAVLHRDQVVAVVVLFDNLLVKAVVDAALENVRIVLGLDSAAACVVAAGVLTEQLDVLLSGVARLLDEFGGLAGAGFEFLALVLDFLVETLENRHDLTFELFLRLQVKCCDALISSVFELSDRSLRDTHLSICPHIFKQACHAAQLLIEMMPLLQRIRDRLEDLLVLLGLGLLHLLGRGDIAFEVLDHVLPGLQSLLQQTRGVIAVKVGHSIFVRCASSGAGRKLCFGHGDSDSTSDVGVDSKWNGRVMGE